MHVAGFLCSKIFSIDNIIVKISLHVVGFLSPTLDAIFSVIDNTYQVADMYEYSDDMPNRP